MVIQKSASLKEQAYRAIRDAIVSKTIRRDQIYSEKWFADNFRISRTPVREALLQLRSEGLIDVIPNRGVIVRNLTMEDAENIFEMRSAIEGYCCARLARHHEEPEARQVLEQIGKALDRCEESFNREDEMFIHLSAIRYAANPLLIAQFDNVSAMVDVFWWNVIQRPSRRDEVNAEHRKIYDCMCAGDAQGAYEASLEHCAITLEKIREGASFDAPEELRPAETPLAGESAI